MTFTLFHHARAFLRTLALAVTPLAAGSCGREAPLPPPVPEFRVVMNEYAFRHEATLGPGRAVIHAINDDRVDHDLHLVELPEDFPRSIGDEIRDPASRGFPTIAVIGRGPGRDGRLAVDLSPGRYAMICFVEDSDGRKHSVKGMSSEFRVR